MAYRTLGDLRSELQSRIGMGAMGASGAAATLLNSFLRNAQAQLWWAQDWKHLTDYKDTDLGVGQNLIDYPTSGTMVAANTAARGKRVLRVERFIGSQWQELREGIRTEDWNWMDSQSYPQRFERLAQILIYPKADAIYTIRCWFVSDCARFTADGDVASLDDEMILLHAVTNAKAHYRHPDAQLYQGQLSTLLSSLRAQSFGSNGVVRRDDRRSEDPKPLVVGRDV